MDCIVRRFFFFFALKCISFQTYPGIDLGHSLLFVLFVFWWLYFVCSLWKILCYHFLDVTFLPSLCFLPKPWRETDKTSHPVCSYQLKVHSVQQLHRRKWVWDVYAEAHHYSLNISNLLFNIFNPKPKLILWLNSSFGFQVLIVFYSVCSRVYAYLWGVMQWFQWPHLF